MRLHLYAQHLLGSGHLVRMKTLAAALAAAGHRVTLFSGGSPMPPPAQTYQLVQLPAIHTAPGDFTHLLDRHARPVSDALRAQRRALLLERVKREAPHGLVVESFPFGRRQFRFELVPLLCMVRALPRPPQVFCSIRDLLQTRNAARHRQTMAELAAWFDHVIAHTDPAVATLAETFPAAQHLEVFHSGYVHQLPNDTDTTATDAVIVSGGGGAVGFRLLHTAIAAHAHCRVPGHWRLLAGRNMPADQFATLRRAAARISGDGMAVERHRADFQGLLARCTVSISQAGYNTVLDVVAAKCRAVLVPFARYGETEQQTRAEKFAALGRAVMLTEANLDAPRLAAAVERAAALDISHCPPIDLDGAAATVRFIEARCTVPQT